MKKLNIGMDGFLKGVTIVVAAGSLISAIFSKDTTKELTDQINDLQQQINDLKK